MTTPLTAAVFTAPQILDQAESLHLDLRLLYEAVIDLSSQGLITANCINMAAGILLNDLGLPSYFFENITKESLKHLLSSITSSIAVQNGKVVLVGRVAHIDFDLAQGNNVQRVRIATQETRDAMEKVIESLISGHRREYYYSRENQYHTYIIRPETVKDFSTAEFRESRFLFNLAGDFTATPEPTRRRYEKVLTDVKASMIPLIEAFNLPASGETRFMFNSDFASPQIPILRKLFEDHGLTLIRAYWEPYWDGSSISTSICSLYIRGEISRAQEARIIEDLRSFLSFSINPVTELYVQGKLTFKEMLFAGNAIDFSRIFLFDDGQDSTDRQIMAKLDTKALKEAFAERIHKANRRTFDPGTIQATAMAHPDLLKRLYAMFEIRFDPGTAFQNTEEMQAAFIRHLDLRFMDSPLSRQIFAFMAKLVFTTLKTNFFLPRKRAFAFRLDHRVLDPLVCHEPVFGIFFVNGHYGCGIHMRAANIARGGLRLVKTTPASHVTLLDNALLVNKATGAQHLKHKDVCESGATGMVIPHATYGEYEKEALLDVTEGIMDLVMGHDTIKDYLGLQEILFFGPDQGTARFMDDLAAQAKNRRYPYWRTLTTGKRSGIPHDTYGMLDNGNLFGLVAEGEAVDVQVEGLSLAVTNSAEVIRKKLGARIRICGMATTGILAAFQTLVSHYRENEKNVNLMVIGGPDGRLSGNPLLSFKGRIPLALDQTALLFDPNGLDRTELERIALTGRTAASHFLVEKLSPQGFKILATDKHLTLPDGRIVADGAVFLRSFLVDPANRTYIRQARIRAFIPFGGFGDPITPKTIGAFLDNFKDLLFIVEGTPFFFNEGARQAIAEQSQIKLIKDSTANKGTVLSSSMAEVLPGLLLGDEYETRLLNDVKTRWALIRETLAQVEANAAAETDLLIQIHKSDPSLALSQLSDRAGEGILALQAGIGEKLSTLLRQKGLVWKILEAYIPKVLIKSLGKKQITTLLNTDRMQEYRDAIITKKLAALAFYRFGLNWPSFIDRFRKDPLTAINSLLDPEALTPASPGPSHP